MNRSLSLFSPGGTVVLDASVLINLDATSRASDIVKALNVRWTVTEAAYAEVAHHGPPSLGDRDSIRRLVGEGSLEVVELGEVGMAVYEDLVIGPTSETLDDGEAATIGYAVESSGIALIDERKATRLCSNRYAELRLASTIDVLLDPAVTGSMSAAAHVDSLVRALQIGRMRVSPPSMPAVLALIGDKAQHCPSLPLNVRSPPKARFMKG